MSQTPSNLQRLAELAADETLGQLSVEDRAELELLREELGVASRGDGDRVLGELFVAFDAAADDADAMPEELSAKLIARGRRIVGSETSPAAAPPIPLPAPGPSRGWKSALVAAGLIAAVSLTVAAVSFGNRAKDRDRWQTERQALELRVEENQTLLAVARTASDELRVALAASESLAAAQREQVLAAQQRELQYAQQLAEATSTIGDLSTRVAMYEEPIPPEILAANRQKLLEVPDTIRVAWQPFDLPDNPAEQQLVRGDVVWNDELEEGYLRFVGLEPNDPSVEQYQVWVIDDRGMEQKVSGGVFNATADGEVIVPIVPGIDVHRVALFAVTIEEPGGTWVPDLKRRVVVAPVEG
ncbi:MAG: anti-sigma factor [Planctomycetota bacterium]|nr:anti-sigma factor [Planctomycetota bacterium]